MEESTKLEFKLLILGVGLLITGSQLLSIGSPNIEIAGVFSLLLGMLLSISCFSNLSRFRRQ